MKLRHATDLNRCAVVDHGDGQIVFRGTAGECGRQLVDCRKGPGRPERFTILPECTAETVVREWLSAAEVVRRVPNPIRMPRVATLMRQDAELAHLLTKGD